MLSRAARVPQRLPPCRTSLSQHLVRRLASTEAADATTKPQTKGAPLRTAYIRSWRPVQNITESWMIVREIEKRYGKVLETHFLKDFEDSGKYQMMTFVVFDDPKSVERIPESGTDVTISSRPVDKPNHEISLEDVEHLVPSGPLTSSIPPEFEEVPAADPRNDSSVLGFRIYRAKLNYQPEGVPRNWIYQRTPGRVLEQFQAWGGFANLAPLAAPRLMKEQELFADPGENEQKRMRAALDLCKRNLERYYPLATPSSVSSIKNSLVDNNAPQELPQEQSAATPKPAPVSNIPASTPTSAPTPVIQEHASTSPSQNAKSKSTTAAKSKSAPQPTKATTSNASETAASKTSAAKATTDKVASPSKKPSPPSKEAAAPKPTGQKLPPPVVQQRPTATIPRRLPKPKIQASKSAPIRSALTQSKTTTEDKNGSEGPDSADAPSTLSKLWGLLTGRRG